MAVGRAPVAARRWSHRFLGPGPLPPRRQVVAGAARLAEPELLGHLLRRDLAAQLVLVLARHLDLELRRCAAQVVVGDQCGRHIALERRLEPLGVVLDRFPAHAVVHRAERIARAAEPLLSLVSVEPFTSLLISALQWSISD